MNVSVYQMALQGSSKDSRGLCFTSETEAGNQSLIYTIPILPDQSHDLLSYLSEIEVHFPGELNGEYYSFKGKFDLTEIKFGIPQLEEEVSFDINVSYLRYPFNYLFPTKSSRLGRLLWNYTGNYRKNIPEMVGLLALAPTDLYKMNYLYNESGVIFVGYTPDFGELIR